MKMAFKSIFIIFLGLVFQGVHAQAGHEHHEKMTMESKNIITIDPARLQSIGVTYEPARTQEIEKIIRTVGHVETDERRTAHIHVRFDGWIEKLFVNFIGKRVKKGDPLFTVYSPELVSTQQEYLLAFQAKNTLGKDAHSKAAMGATGAFDAARQKLLLMGISNQAIKNLQHTEKVSKTLAIDSPIEGTVINKTAVVGMRIEPNSELYTIADLSKLWILGDIYEYELPYVHVGQMAEVSLSYLPNKMYQSKLEFIYPTIDAQTRTVKARFEIDNQHNELKPGMYVNIELKIPLGKHLVVPKDAVLMTGERAVIFIYHGDGKIEWRNVKLGVRSGDVIEVLEGIKEGDDIITSANFLIDSESQLKAAMGGMQH